MLNTVTEMPWMVYKFWYFLICYIVRDIPTNFKKILNTFSMSKMQFINFFTIYLSKFRIKLGPKIISIDFRVHIDVQMYNIIDNNSFIRKDAHLWTECKIFRTVLWLKITFIHIFNILSLWQQNALKPIINWVSLTW